MTNLTLLLKELTRSLVCPLSGSLLVDILPSGEWSNRPARLNCYSGTWAYELSRAGFFNVPSQAILTICRLTLRSTA